MGWLKWGLTTRKHEKKGWLAETLIKNGELIIEHDSLRKRVLSDYRCRLAYREDMKEVLANKFKDPRGYKGVKRKKSEGKFVSLKKQSQAHVPKNVQSLAYLLYAYVLSKTSFFRKRDAEKCGSISDKQRSLPVGNDARFVQTGRTAIDNSAIARDFYNRRFFFACEKAMGTTVLLDKNGNVHPGWTIYQARPKHWGLT